ncbi:adhesion G-protein coupled receptor G2-like [Centroberyx affinis]|uniref:adhesion G-protein coupled receptor G2-like n=1 Tax=Centroberyx affinis TaxID=166261 RepID=UPI003A5BBE4C
MHRVSPVRSLLSMDEKQRWTFTLTIAALLFGFFRNGNLCESHRNGSCPSKHLLIVTAMNNDTNRNLTSTPNCSDTYHLANGTNLCIRVVKENQTEKIDCCHTGDSQCTLEIRKHEETYSLTLNEDTLQHQDIILYFQGCFCMPSALYNNSSAFLLNLENCTRTGMMHRITQNNLSCENSVYDNQTCKGTDVRKLILDVSPDGNKSCVRCNPTWNETATSTTPPPSQETATSTTPPPSQETATSTTPPLPQETASTTLPPPSITIPPLESNNGSGISAEKAAEVMESLPDLVKQMGNATTAAISAGDVKGLINKLPPKNQTDIIFGFSPGDDKMRIVENVLAFSRSVHISKEASVRAVNRNGSFVGVLQFPGISQDEENSIVFNNEVLGIDMGIQIANLSDTIDIHYRNVDKRGASVSCNSWDGKGKRPKWTTKGCHTKESNNSFTCQCTHLTFFAVLMSPPTGNLSSSDVTSLTYITSIGCGLSMFFLAGALFMHCVMRKRKSTQAIKILVNLFIAMFSLNFAFLINEQIANLGNFGACVAIAAVMHYTMLATFSWFFIEALHLYLQLRNVPTEIKHYMVKICITGWVTPALVVIAIVAAGKYTYMVINTDDGNSVKMCWISDVSVHQGVNIGYYAVVFIFTFIVFIMVVWHIYILRPKAGNTQETSSIKTNTFSILSLLLLLGITWAFAFFSHGPLTIASYYIFTILNSFQGFFLFFYYYNISKTVREDRISTLSSSGTATSNTYVISPYAPQQ